MNLYKVTVGKKGLYDLSKEEVLFFVQAGAALNELNILHKLLMVSNKEVSGSVETKAQNSQTLFILSILTGKLWECWKLLQNGYFKSKLSITYDKYLSNEANNHLQYLKQYFGKDNLIKEIRHRLAFHYDAGVIENQLNEFLDDEIPEFYLSEGQGNSFFYISDMIRMNIILGYTNKPDPLEALDTFFKEVLDTGENFIQFFNHCLTVVARNHKEWKIEKIEVNDPPLISDVFLPYFVGKPRL